MKYDFNTIIDRRETNSSKWNKKSLENLFGRGDLMSYWVADMDFKVAPEIREALIERAEFGIFGYEFMEDDYYNAIINWTERRFDFKIEKDWIQFTPGIVPAIYYAIQSYTKPGDKVLIQQPVYYPFKNAIDNTGRRVVNNQLLYENGKYEIDFEDLEEKLQDPKLKLFVLCSPHNPISRLWTKAELEKMGDLCVKHDVIVVSDEIHNDLVLFDNKHYMFPSIKEEFKDISITCTSASKSFNIAGLQGSNIIIPNEHLRREFQHTLDRNAVYSVNAFSYIAIKAAYEKGEAWLEELLSHLESNYKFMVEYLNEHLPKAYVLDLEATYLAWIDLRAYCEDGKILEDTIVNKGKVALDGGSWFGEAGNGFMRMNFACPKETLEKGLEGLVKGVKAIK